MNKQQQTKSAMGYVEKPVHPCCGNCSSYTLKRVVIGVCTLGKFKTFKTALCDKHEFNNPQNQKQ